MGNKQLGAPSSEGSGGRRISITVTGSRGESKVVVDHGQDSSGPPSPEPPSLVSEIKHPARRGDMHESVDAEVALCLFDYEARSDQEIGFAKGEKIMILDKSRDPWWEA